MGVNTGLEYLDIGCICRTDNVTEAWEYWYKELEELQKNGFSDTSRDGNVVGEFINAITIISDPRNNIVNSDIRKLNLRYMIGEFLWYNASDNSLAGIQNYTKAWDRMSDNGTTVNSNYGHKIREFYGFDQWEYVKGLLNKDSNSRQAIIHIKNPNSSPSKDVPCTISLQFFIRDNKLFLTTYMRSNDIWMGFPYDVFNFCCFQIQMAMELGVEIGCYTHISGSLHLYERNSRLKSKESKDEPCNCTCGESCQCRTEFDETELDGYLSVQENHSITVKRLKKPEGLHRII